MTQYALIHEGSGSIICLSSINLSPPAGLIGVEVNDSAVNGESHWWTGTAFSLREDADISLSKDQADAGTRLTITGPDQAWYCRPDGSFSQAKSFSTLADLRINRVSMIGRYRGNATAEIN